MGVMEAYEKMFEDGSAYKPIKIEQPTPDNPAGGFGVGDPDNNRNLFEDHMQNRDMDDIIEEAKELKRRKTGKVIRENRSPTPIQKSAPVRSISESKKVKELERRVSILEQALQLVMETQTKILKENG